MSHRGRPLELARAGESSRLGRLRGPDSVPWRDDTRPPRPSPASRPPALPLGSEPFPRTWAPGVSAGAAAPPPRPWGSHGERCLVLPTCSVLPQPDATGFSKGPPPPPPPRGRFLAGTFHGKRDGPLRTEARWAAEPWCPARAPGSPAKPPPLAGPLAPPAVICSLSRAFQSQRRPGRGPGEAGEQTPTQEVGRLSQRRPGRPACPSPAPRTGGRVRTAAGGPVGPKHHGDSHTELLSNESLTHRRGQAVETSGEASRREKPRGAGLSWAGTNRVLGGGQRRAPHGTAPPPTAQPRRTGDPGGRGAGAFLRVTLQPGPPADVPGRAPATRLLFQPDQRRFSARPLRAQRPRRPRPPGPGPCAPPGGALARLGAEPLAGPVTAFASRRSPRGGVLSAPRWGRCRGRKPAEKGDAAWSGTPLCY